MLCDNIYCDIQLLGNLLQFSLHISRFRKPIYNKVILYSFSIVYFGNGVDYCFMRFFRVVSYAVWHLRKVVAYDRIFSLFCCICVFTCFCCVVVPFNKLFKQLSISLNLSLKHYNFALISLIYWWFIWGHSLLILKLVVLSYSLTHIVIIMTAFDCTFKILLFIFFGFCRSRFVEG